MKVIIQSNKFQNLAAKVSRYSFIKNGFTDVEIINVENCEILKKYHGKKYLRNGKLVKYDLNDLQSFTLLRFIPNDFLFKGLCLVIDPDIFSVKNSQEHISAITSKDFDIYCTKIDNKFRSEVMIINLNKKIWDFDTLINNLFDLKIDYSDLISLKFVETEKIQELNKNFNHHDVLNDETFFLHTSNRITQPWKEGLNINFNNYFSKLYRLKNYIKMILNMEYDRKVMLNKFINHPDDNVNKFVTNCFKEALANNFISKYEILDAVKKKYLSKKFANRIIDAK